MPVEHVVVSLKKGDGGFSFTTGYGGDFYLDDVAPGDYDASFATPAGACGFKLRLPSTKDILTKLNTITARCDLPSPL